MKPMDIDERRIERGEAIATELRCLNWVLWSLYGIIAWFVFGTQLGREDPFYPEPPQFYYGLIAMPAFFFAWFGFLIADLVHRFRWKRLAASIATAAAVVAGYFVIGIFTVWRG